MRSDGALVLAIISLVAIELGALFIAGVLGLSACVASERKLAIALAAGTARTVAEAASKSILLGCATAAYLGVSLNDEPSAEHYLAPTLITISFLGALTAYSTGVTSSAMRHVWLASPQFPVSTMMLALLRPSAAAVFASETMSPTSGVSAAGGNNEAARAAGSRPGPLASRPEKALHDGRAMALRSLAMSDLPLLGVAAGFCLVAFRDWQRCETGLSCGSGGARNARTLWQLTVGACAMQALLVADSVQLWLGVGWCADPPCRGSKAPAPAPSEPGPDATIPRGPPVAQAAAAHVSASALLRSSLANGVHAGPAAVASNPAMAVPNPASAAALVLPPAATVAPGPITAPVVQQPPDSDVARRLIFGERRRGFDVDSDDTDTVGSSPRSSDRERFGTAADTGSASALCPAIPTGPAALGAFRAASSSSARPPAAAVGFTASMSILQATPVLAGHGPWAGSGMGAPLARLASDSDILWGAYPKYDFDVPPHANGRGSNWDEMASESMAPTPAQRGAAAGTGLVAPPGELDQPGERQRGVYLSRQDTGVNAMVAERQRAERGAVVREAAAATQSAREAAAQSLCFAPCGTMLFDAHDQQYWLPDGNHATKPQPDQQDALASHGGRGNVAVAV